MKKEKKAFSILEGALRKGSVMHAFLSGGGLRVIRLEKGRHGKLTGYGEHPHVDEALRHAAEDFAAGGRPYSEVYGTFDFDHPEGGKKGIYPMYLTGASTPDGELDAWVRQGHTFDARFEGGEFVFELRGLEESRTPEGYVKRCTAGETIRWTDERGVTYECSPSRFPNGEACCSTRIVSRPRGMKEHRAWMYYAVRTGKGQTLEEAVAAAFKAPKIEVEDST